MAKFLPAGSDLVFQIQYIANGRAAADQSSIELIFSKHAPERRVLTLQLTNDHFVIPPGAPDYRVEARGTLPNDATLFSFFPHMHLRGKRFEYNLIRKKMSADGKPDDEIEPLLRVNYRFHWQMSYRLAEPRFLRAETELQASRGATIRRRIRTIRMRMQRCLRRADLRRNDGGLFRRGGTGGGRQAALFHPERSNDSKFAPERCTNGQAQGVWGGCGRAICNLNT